MGKSIDIDALRGRRDERYKEYLESKELAEQLDAQVEQLKLQARRQWVTVNDRHSATQELNDLISVVDPEGTEAQNKARAGQLPVDTTTGEKEEVAKSERGSMDSSDSNGPDEPSDDSVGDGDLRDESQKIGEGHEQNGGFSGEGGKDNDGSGGEGGEGTGRA